MLADAFRSYTAYDARARAALDAVLPRPHRRALGPVLDAWAAEPDLPGVAVACAIEAVQASSDRGDHAEVSVVSTGPSSPWVPVRLTSQVVPQLIDSAARRVTISSFSSYRMPAVITALDSAVNRGVQVDLILESREQLSSGGAESFSSYRVFVWPSEQRPPNARLHAKTVTVDDDVVLFTSANMSNAAFDSNLELGALVRGGGVARSIQQHFDALIAAGVLVPLPTSAPTGPLQQYDTSELDLISDDRARQLAESTIRAGGPTPVAGFEPDAPGAPGWEIEVAWPDQRVAILADDDAELSRWLDEQGWDARLAADWKPDQLLDALRRTS
jgi:hypothetical protein